MTLYILLYSLLLCTIFLDRDDVAMEKKKLALKALVLLFTLFRGLRWNTGTDWEPYLSVFEEADWDNIFSLVHDAGFMEPGYVFLNVLVKSLGGNYTLFLLLTNFFLLVSYSRFSLYMSSRPLWTFVVLLFTIAFFPVRQTLAVGIVLFGYRYLLERNGWKYLLVVLAASTIHASALVCLPFYYILRTRIPGWLFIGAFLFCAFILNDDLQYNLMSLLIGHIPYVGDMIMPRLTLYMELTAETLIERNEYLSNILLLFFILLFTYLKKRIPATLADKYALLYNMYFYSVIISLFFKNNMQHLGRVGSYFSLSFPVLFSVLIMWAMQLSKTGAYAFFIAYMAYKLIVSLNGYYPDLHIPYFSIFDENPYRAG